MSVNSFAFLLFFVVVFFIYFFPLREKSKAQNVLLLLASYFFYGYADWKMLPLLVAVTLAFYGLGIGIAYYRSMGDEKKGAALSATGIVLGAGLLLYFKYLNFFITSFTGMFESFGFQTNVSTFNILLPLGISFFTFRLISYAIEVNRGNIAPVRNIVTFGTYVAFFPCLLSGPIDRPQKFIPQLEKKRPFSYDMAVDGLRQILWGMFKKMVIADNLATIIHGIWSGYATESGSTLLLGAIFYSFQIYADFSGYSDMAIGVAKVLGFEVARNFNYPYFARNVSEFWRKWHMSLTSWFTDYIYIPLGGNRCSKGRQFFNTMVVFTICGFWHGANWTFVLWGAYNGLLFLPLILRKKKKLSKVVAEGKWLPNLQETLNMLGTFVLVTFGWILFKATNVGEAFDYMARIFSPSLFSVPQQKIGLLYVLVLVASEWAGRRKEYVVCVANLRWQYRWVLYFVLFLSIFILSGKVETFIYAKF